MVSRVLDAFQWGAGGAKLTPEQVARQREIAASLMQRGNPAFHNAGWLGALGRGLEGAYSGWQEGRADRAEAENAELSRNTIASILSGIGGGAPAEAVGVSPEASSTPIAPIADPVTDRVASAHSTGAAPGKFSGSRQEFIDMLLPAAMEASQRTGIDPRIIVAQAAQETGWGRSAPGNNFFGIKSHGQGGGQALKTHEYINGNRVNVTDNFRTFADPADSVRGYADFILNNPRYKPLMAAQGLDAQLEALQASGYATDPNYSRSVGSIARGIPLPSQQPTQAALESLAVGESLPGPEPTYAQAPMQVAQAGGINPAIIEAISSPYVNDQTRQIAQLLLGQQIQANDPMRQLQMERAQLEIDALRNPQQKPIEVGGVLLDPNTMQPIFDSRDNTPASVREYEFYRQQAGSDALPYDQWDIARRQSGATNISNVIGGESDAFNKKFNETMGAAQAKTFTDAIETGDQAQRNRINLDRLSQLASNTPQGLQGAIINTLGEFGIKTEGLDNVQAMESLISQLVPTQRPPGSGTISDADLKLYKASLPRLINTPEGNRLILETMYAINDHDIAAAEIASRVASGEISPADGRKEMRNIPNPFDNWQDRVKDFGGDQSNTVPSDVDPEVWEFMTPEERALFQ